MRKMKESGISWIGLVPYDWKIMRLKYVSDFYNGYRGSNYPSGDDLVEEGIPFLTSNNIHGETLDVSDEITKYITQEKYDSLGGAKVMKNDIIFCLRGSVGTCAINKSIDEGTVASSLVDIRPKKIDPNFLNYVLNSPLAEIQTLDFMNGSCALNLSAENVSSYVIFVPSIPEQHRISTYLDAKCAEIDALTVDIQTQIDTLEQYKRSVITETVTRGLDKNVEKKESGSQYWGDIPVKWDIVDIKYLFEIVKRIAGHEGYDILSITQHGIKVRDTSKNEGQVAADYSNYQFLYPGEYAMNHMDLLTGWVDLSDKFGVTSPDYRVFRLRDTKRNSRRYYKYIMQICYMCRIFYSLGNGVSNLGRWRLQTSSFNNFKVPVPPYEEQEEISDYLDAKIREIEATIEIKNEQLSTLDLFKKSLIYEYVTGKKEVPAV